MCLGIPGKVLSIDDGELRMGRVDFGGVIKQACLAYVPEANPGEYVVVHAGFAISRIDETEARRVFDYLSRIDELETTKGER